MACCYWLIQLDGAVRKAQSLESLFNRFFHNNEVCEIRALGLSGKSKVWPGFCSRHDGGIVRGYFNDPQTFATAAAELDDAGASGVYFTINPLKPALLARCANRVEPNAKHQASDTDVSLIRWLLIDLDPRRPAGISSTDEEFDAARQKAQMIAAFLEDELKFGRGIRAESGNGFHLLYRIEDLANTEENKRVLRKCLLTLGEKFDDDHVDVDKKVFNPARIWKLYGTWARKGDDTAERPHRKSHMLDGQPGLLSDVPVTEKAKLLKLIEMAPEESPRRPLPSVSNPQKATETAPVHPVQKHPWRSPQSLGKMDVRAYLEHYGINVIKEKPTGSGAVLFCLSECLFDPNHRGNEAAIVQSDTAPYLTYQCFHSSCRNRTWREAREHISGNDSLAPFCEGYETGWKPPVQQASPAVEIQINADASFGPAICIIDAPVPPPEKVDPQLWFFEKGEKGRPKFIPAYLAKYLIRLFEPISFTDGEFWQYRNGLWRKIGRSILFSAGTYAMGDLVQPDYVEKGIKVAAGLVNKEETEWPEQSGYINCINGMIDIEALYRGKFTEALVPHDAKFGSRVQIPCRFDLDAEFDRWARFLTQVFPEDHFDLTNDGQRKERHIKSSILQRFFGYCLLKDCRFQKALFLYGTGANGKSTVLNILETMVGRENTSSLSIASLGLRFQTQFLQNKLVNIATETNTRDPIGTEIFKAVVAGDSIAAERKYGEPYSFRPHAKFLVAMNDIPVIPDKSSGFERRLIVLDFKRKFTENEMDPRMTEKLVEEIDGIFMWALDGLAQLLSEGGFNIPSQVKEETRRFMQALNPLLIFVDECCVLASAEANGPTDSLNVQKTRLYAKYKEWCQEGGNRALSRNKFYDQLMIGYPQVTEKLKPIADNPVRQRCFAGICIRDEAFSA